MCRICDGEGCLNCDPMYNGAVCSACGDDGCQKCDPEPRHIAVAYNTTDGDAHLGKVVLYSDADKTIEKLKKKSVVASLIDIKTGEVLFNGDEDATFFLKRDLLKVEAVDLDHIFEQVYYEDQDLFGGY